MPDWDRRYRDAAIGEAQPARVLLDYAHLLPVTGTALDLACGLGGNALFLAGKGLETHAWDSSAVAIEKLRTHARAIHPLPLQAEVRDAIYNPPSACRFDVITVSRFLARDLAPRLMDALKPGGLLFYQTFILDKQGGVGPSNPDFLLGENELLHLFSPLILRAYREEGQTGDTTTGWRNEAMLVGQKPLL